MSVNCLCVFLEASLFIKYVFSYDLILPHCCILLQRYPPLFCGSIWSGKRVVCCWITHRVVLYAGSRHRGSLSLSGVPMSVDGIRNSFKVFSAPTHVAEGFWQSRCLAVFHSNEITLHWSNIYTVCASYISLMWADLTPHWTETHPCGRAIKVPCDHRSC